MLHYKIPSDILRIHFETFSGERIENYEGDLEGYVLIGSLVDGLIPDEMAEDYCKPFVCENDVTNIFLKNGRLYITCDLCGGRGQVEVDQWMEDPLSGNHVAGILDSRTEGCCCDGGGYYLNFG